MTNVNNNDIDRIVGELISLEPELNDKKDQLRELVSRLLEAKPDVKVDDQFVARLRRELLAGEQNAIAAPIANFNQFMTKLKYALGGSAVMAVLVLIAVFAATPGKDGASHQTLSNLIAFDSEIQSGVEVLQPNAFGRLAQTGFGTDDNFVGVESYAAGGRGSEVVKAPAADSAMIEPAVPISIGMPAPEYQPIELTYQGGELPALSEQMLVYRRMKGLDLSGLNSAVVSQDNGLIDLNKFRDLQVNNLSLRNQNQGVWVNINPIDATASISIEGGSERVAMYEENVEPVPDEDLIQIANAALNKYGVDYSGYGAPVVNHSWRNYLAIEGMGRSFPMHINVVYPLTFPEGEVIQQDGTPYGLSVMINVVERKAQNIHMITVQRYESSQYAAEIDANRLIEYAEQGGSSGAFYYPVTEQGAVTLGTPVVHYILQHQYNAELGTTNELYVPALFFPVELEGDSKYYHPKYVVVPLISELLDNGDGRGGIRPMPLREMEAASGGAVEIAAPPPGETMIIKVEQDSE